MKTKRILSAVLTLVFAMSMVFSFALVSEAKTDESKNAAIDFVVEDVNNQWVISAVLTLDEEMYYAYDDEAWTDNGIGVCAFQFNIDGFTKANVAKATLGETATALTTGTLSDGSGFSTSWQNGMVCSAILAGGQPLVIAKFALKLRPSTTAKEVVEEMAKGIQYTSVKIANFANVEDSTITNDMITTYAVGDDGMTIDPDADYVLTTPLNKGGDDEEDESELVATANREAKTANATYQIGTGVGMKVTAPEGIAFTKMIWAITKGAERVYSAKVDFPVAVSGDVSVAATFVNGTHNGNYNAEVKESYEIGEDDFDAIFCGVDAEGIEADYFTNEADAANKAE